MDYLDFELRFASDEAGSYSVTVLDAPGGDGCARLELSLSDPHLRSCLEVMERPRGRPGSPVPGPSLSTAVQTFGQALFTSLTQEKGLYACYHASLLEAQKAGKGLRLRLRFANPELARLPWEYLYDTEIKRGFLCLSKETPLVRHLELELPVEALTLKPPLRILGMVGAHAGLGVAAEQQRMAQAVEHLTEKGAVELVWVDGCTWRHLSNALRHGEWHIFHFIGHGGFNTKTGEGLILLEKEGEAGALQHFPAGDLADLLAGHPPLRLAVLNSCEGARASATNLFSSTGATLAGRGIAAVVSMQYEISDRAAVEFSRTFYDSLADGEGVDAAVTESRQAIKMALGETVEWGTPVLHMRAKSGSLFRVDLQSALGLSPATAPPPPPAIAAPRSADVQGLLILLRKVRQIWVDGALAQSAQRSDRLELGLETMAGAVSSPWETLAPGAGSEPVPAGRSIAEVFEETGGSLLILGEPGSGKTVTLLELARDLLARAETDPSRPVPVLFPLSSWTDPKRRLADWLADELAVKYQIPKKFGQSWVQERRLLPLLDGLDEVRAEIRAACVEAINAFTQELLTGAVLCCRLKEYLELPVRLALNSAVRLLPLSREQVLAFLAAAGDRLAALSNLLQRDSAMLMDARSPLMLSLMVQAYQGLPAAALETESADSLAARRRKVMESYVARMFHRAGGPNV
jgi:hypothetical protein